jgi:hypothetical protein
MMLTELGFECAVMICITYAYAVLFVPLCLLSSDLLTEAM